MYINSNISAINANRNLRLNNDLKAKTMEKLSSGFRINRAADDAAGLAISEKMRYQINGLQQASRNIQDGISLVQTADGGMQEIQAMLQRMNVLANQASNGTYTDSDRAKIDLEFQQLKREINSIANNTNFNGINLLNSGSKPINFTSYKGENLNSVSSSTLIGAKNNKLFAGGVEIISDINDELTVKFDGTSYSIKIAAGLYSGSATTLFDEINTKFLAIGAPVKLSDIYGAWDDTHMRMLLTSTISGSHTIEIEGTAFNEIFTEENNTFGNYEVWGREADFSVGYTVEKGVNDTLNFIENGNQKTIVLTEGAYSRDELIEELNNQFTNVGANITASMSPAIGVNVSAGPGNKHYILGLKHNFSNSDNAIQLVSGNALNPLFIRSANSGDVWTPKTTSYMKTDIDISNGLTVGEGQNEWKFIVDGYIEKTIVLNATSYTSTDLIDEINKEFNNISAGIIAVNDNGVLKFEREMNGSSYTVTDFRITNNSVLQLQVGVSADDIFTVELSDVTTSSLGINGIDLTTRQGAESAISKIDKAIGIVSSERSKFGAYQNALEHIYNNVLNSAENLSSAHSRIRDADMAQEMTSLTKAQILAEAGQAMLIQANTLPQNILKLLG